MGLLTGTIRGTVTDKSGKVLPGVVITANAHVESYRRNAVTNVSGQYRFVSLPPDTYSLTSSLVGFETQRKEIQVDANETVVVDFELALRLG